MYRPVCSDGGRWRLTWNAPSGPAVVVPVTEPGRLIVVAAFGEQPVPDTSRAAPGRTAGWSSTSPAVTPAARDDGVGEAVPPGEVVGAGVAVGCEAGSVVAGRWALRFGKGVGVGVATGL